VDYLLRENDQLENCEGSAWSPKRTKVPYQTLTGLKFWRKLTEKSSLFFPNPKILHMQSAAAFKGNLKCQYLYLLPLYIYAS